MKRKLGVMSLAVLALLSVFAPVKAETQASAASIVFVDNNQVLAESTAMRDVQAQIEKKRVEFQKEISAKETSLRQESEKLMAKEKKAAPEQFKADQKKFEAEVEKIKELVEVRRRQLEVAYARVMEKLQKAFQDAVQKTMNKHQATVVLQKAAAISLANAKLDLTAEVVSLLNKDVPKLSVVFPNAQEITILAKEAGAPKK